MKWRNSQSEWGGVSKLFHWTMAALIIGSSILVLHINDSTWWFKSSPEIFIAYLSYHKAIGIIALVLVAGRILWRRRNPVPVTAPLTPFEHKASTWTHRGLYTLMVAVPLLGWLSSSSFGRGVDMFGLFNVPPIWPEDKVMINVFYWSHFVLAWMLLIIIAVHAGAALYHHFKKRDAVLRSMLPGAPR